MSGSLEPTREFFDEVYRQKAPWDVGMAQPALEALFDEFPPSSPVLDVGCGTGDLALALAARRLTVIGVDLADAAIQQAREKAGATADDVKGRTEFRVLDALHPAAVGGPFGAVTDSGFFHVFGDEKRRAFSVELAEALRVGGRYYLLGFAIEYPVANSPRAVREEELRELFSPADGWRVLAIRAAKFATASFGEIPAIAACIERVEAPVVAR